MLAPRFANDGRRLERLNGIQTAALERHLSKLLQGTYRLEAAQCPVCEVSDDLVLAEKDRYGIPMRVVICRGCGLIRTDPRLTASDFADFYNTEYRQLYGGSASPTDLFFEQQVAHGEQIIQRLGRLGRMVDSRILALEVGCGAGGILHAFHQRGAEIVGCDLGEEYLQFGRDQHGLDLRRGSLADLKLSRPVDVVIYSHVLEHVLDLNSEIEGINHVLAADGLVYIEVPSVKNIHQSYQSDFLGLLQNAHTFHFTARTLLSLMNQHGFKPLAATELVWAVFARGPQGAILSDFEPAMAFLRRAEYLRPMYFLHPFYLRARLVDLFSAIGLKQPIRKILGRK